MSHVLESNPQLQDHMLKSKRLVVRFSITGNATPASVTSASDISGCVEITTQGSTPSDTGMNVTEDDGATDSTFGILVKNIGSVRKVQSARVTDLGTETGGSDTSTACVVTFAGASNTGITASGNIALSVAAAGLDIGAAENFAGLLELEYLSAE